MEKPGGIKFEVGQLAELKTFAEGYRGAWFRCKVRDIERNKIQLEYYDFEEEQISWEKIYDAPPYGRKSKHIKKQLMLRPRYPLMCKKNEMPSANSISDVCVVIDGTWKVGDMVDWYYDSSYWSAKVIKVLSDDKVQIKLPMPPAGEGDKSGPHEAFCKDLRPFLDWSQRKGWTLPTVEGRTSCSAQLIFPSKQGMDSEVRNSAGSPLNAWSSTRISAEGDTERHSSEPVDTVTCEEKAQSEDVRRDHDLAEGDTERQRSGTVDTVICEDKVPSTERQSSAPVDAVTCAEKAQSEGVKMDDNFPEGGTERWSSVNADTVTCVDKVQSKDVIMDHDFAEGDIEGQNSDLVVTVIRKEKVQNEDVEMPDDLAEADAERQSSNPVDTVMCEEKVQNEDMKLDDNFMESSDSISSLRVEENKAAAAAVANEVGIDYRTDLNIMHEDTLEAAILDLEELANKVKWMQNLLNSNGNPSSNDFASWKFV